jgi:phospholipid/cholesterol/gamma-HCH transport system permease protein
MNFLPEFIFSKDNHDAIISITGRLDAKGASSLWQAITQKISNTDLPNLTLDLERVNYLDTAGATFIYHIEKLARTRGVKAFFIVNLKQEFSPLVELTKSINQTDFSDQKPK